MSNRTVTIWRHLARFVFAALATFLLLSNRWPVFSSNTAYRLSTESITFFSSATLETPKTVFTPGEKVWALSSLSPLSYGAGSTQRRIQWVAPDGSIKQQRDITTNSPSDSYQIPASASVGTWLVKIVDVSNVGLAAAKFIVRDPANRAADLAVTISAAPQFAAGDKVTYLLTVTNNGPDDAEDVELVDATSKGATFLSLNNPPEWNCSASADKATCNGSRLASGASALVTVVYQTNDSAPANTKITNTAIVSSRTAELHQPDNRSSLASTTLASACVLGCPEDVTRSFEAGKNGAMIDYADPATPQTCNGVTCNPPSGSFFSAGVTTVTCSSENGEACSFKVTITGTVAINVIGANPLLMECHTEFRDAEVTAQNSAGDSIPVASSGNVDTTTPGIYTITYTAEEGANTATATRTIEVVDTTPPTISGPTEVIALADANCKAVVPNFIGQNLAGKIKAFDACTPVDALLITQTPAAGTLVGIGVTTVTISAKDAAKNVSDITTTFLVNPVSFGSATVLIGTKNSDDAGIKFDLLAEVLINGKLVASDQINEVTGGGREFNNAIARTFNLNSAAPAFFCSGDTLGIRLSVRVSASSVRRNATARLWLSETAAGNNLVTTIGGVTTGYSFQNEFTLSAPTKVTNDKLLQAPIDLFFDRATSGNAFKPFGTWSKTF
ncbi:MAG: immunoglobulin-like domain-containing protein [Blastocatellia bacterium]